MGARWAQAAWRLRGAPRAARLALAAVALLVALLGGASVALSGTPVPPPYTSTMSGTLNPRGDTRNFTFNYPGDNSIIWVEMSLAPADPISMNYAGCAIYAPGGGAPVGTARPGAPPGQYFSTQGKVLPFSSAVAGSFTLQVYNYSPTNAVKYVVSTLGVTLMEAQALVPSPAAPPAPGATPTPDGSTPDRWQPITSAAAQQGTLGPANQFAFYQFPYPGDQSTIWLTASFSPADPITMAYAGFNLYRPDGVQDASANLGAPPGYPAAAANNSKTTPYASSMPGNYTIQVYDYSPTTAVTYVLSVIGLPATATAR